MTEKITIEDVQNLTNIHNELCFKINNNYAFKIFKKKEYKNINFVKEHINNFNKFKNNLTDINYTIHILNVMYKNNNIQNENFIILYKDTKEVLMDLKEYYNSFLENSIKINNFIL